MTDMFRMLVGRSTGFVSGALVVRVIVLTEGSDLVDGEAAG